MKWEERGYSLVEVVVAVFILAAVVMAAFSVFEAGSKQSLKVENQMLAASLSREIVEEIHSLYSVNLSTTPFARFAPPFDRFEYIYSVQQAGYPNLPNLQEITVQVQGPVLQDGTLSVQGVSTSLSFLLARQTYTP